MSTLSTAAEAASVGSRFLRSCARFGDAVAFRHPSAEGWVGLTWNEMADRATALAAGLIELGIAPGERVAIAASTRIEWVLADLAVALAGAVTTTVYPNTNAEDVAYILEDCGAVAVFAEDTDQVAKLRADGRWVGQVRTVVTFGRRGDEDTLGWDDLAALGRTRLRTDPACVRDTVASVGPEDLATIIYTSGTTGRPKGVELTHANWRYLVEAVASQDVLRRDHVQLLWLPLSHVFGKMLLAVQYEVGFSTAIDGRIDRIVDNLAAVQPTMMAAAPRIFEKIHGRVQSSATARGGIRAVIFKWAFRIGVDAVRRRQGGQAVGFWGRARLAVADRLVFHAIRERLGGRLEILVCGSAALATPIAEWFAAAGLPLLEGYGLTEATCVSFVNRPGRHRIGTVGPALPGTEVRIAADGEILLRGGGIMRGYHRLPEATVEVIDADGWFATGDIGELDADGYLRITDRKKDLAKTSGGKYVAPTAIESALKAACPLIGNAIVIAEGRKFASLLVTLDPDAIDGRSREEIESALGQAVADVNAGLNRWETVKRFRILPRELSVEAGEITPSLKIKRAVVAHHFAEAIESMYQEDPS
ncbi:AMP-dependent synthetase/ligase [Glycomyces artemisiae]|nr:long-chain fatty acid--CoA ligase [Glycomyces artemisiae]